jgi:hypothetical protein
MIHLQFFDAHTVVRGDASRLAQIERLWSPFVRSLVALPADAKVLSVEGLDFPTILSKLVVDINALALASCPDLAIHAGAVDVGGRTIALPGTSGAGKSTLTAACVRAGMSYVSDEALCIRYDTSGVRAYPRPVALSPWSIHAIGLDDALSATRDSQNAAVSEFIVAPSVLGPICETPGPVRHVVVPRRGAGERAELSPWHRADAVALLLKLSFNHYQRPSDAFELMMNTVRSADVWVLRYSEPTNAARLLLERFG